MLLLELLFKLLFEILGFLSVERFVGSLDATTGDRFDSDLSIKAGESERLFFFGFFAGGVSWKVKRSG